MKEYCLDISTWQGGIDYNDIRSKTNYVIIRAGFGDSDFDNQFENHYNNLQGLHLGAYWYSYATSPDQARVEANLFLQAVQGKKFDLPLYIDMEEQSGLSTDLLNSIVIAFGEVIENAGYYFGVYCNVNWYNNILSGNYLNSKYDWWIACWGDEPPSPSYGINYGVWQFTSNDYVGGKRVDANFMYKDYPTIIRELGLNHLDDDPPVPPTPPTPTPGNEVNVYYRVKTQAHGWLPEVRNLDDYAGYEGSPVIGFMVRVDKGWIEYQGHNLGGGYLGWVNGYDENDFYNGYAGNDNVLDTIKIYYHTPDDIIARSGYKKAKYKVNNYDWQYDTETSGGQDGYAGKTNNPITELRITIE